MDSHRLPRRTLLGASLWPVLGARAATTRVRLPRHTSMADPQLVYVSQLIKLALSRAQVDGVVEFTSLEMAQSRSLVELAAGRSPFDLMWTVTDQQREDSRLIPIRIPLDRGMMGWRLLLVRESDLDRWQHLRGLDDLRQCLAGQGHDWPDTAILRANGLQVGTSSGYESLFRMLAAGRFDYFPRSILEIDAEMADNRHAGLVIAPRLMLHYPAAAYLFVSPLRPELARTLQTGLEAAVADGSFQQLHHEHFGALVKAHAVPRERVLRLTNPLLPARTPLQRQELWLQPGEPAVRT